MNNTINIDRLIALFKSNDIHQTLLSVRLAKQESINLYELLKNDFDVMLKEIFTQKYINQYTAFIGHPVTLSFGFITVAIQLCYSYTIMTDIILRNKELDITFYYVRIQEKDYLEDHVDTYYLLNHIIDVLTKHIEDNEY